MSDLTTHVIVGGRTLCGVFGNDPPEEWPEDHVWTRENDLKNVTCPTCKQMAEKRAEAQNVPQKS